MMIRLSSRRVCMSYLLHGRSSLVRRRRLSRGLLTSSGPIEAVQRSFVESFKNAQKQPNLFLIQTIGASIVLYSYSETDVALLRVWAVTGLVCYSVIPNIWRGQAILASWGIIFVMINGVRLYELMAQRAPVQLNADELIAYSTSGWHRFLPPQTFKRLANSARVFDAYPDAVLKQESCEFHQLVIILSGSIVLTIYGKPVGKPLKAGDIVGVPTTESANNTAAHYKVKATAGKEGARLMSWSIAELMEAVKAELDPNTEIQLIRFFSEKLVRELETRDHIALLKSYHRMLALAIRDAVHENNGIIQADHKAALLEFRRTNGVAQDEHVQALKKFGWSLEEWQIGTKSQPERTKAALLSLSKRIKIASNVIASNNSIAVDKIIPAAKIMTLPNTSNEFPSLQEQKPPPPPPPQKKQTQKQISRRPLLLRTASSRLTWTKDLIPQKGGSLDEVARRIALLHRQKKTPEPAQMSPRSARPSTKKHRQKLLSIFEPPTTTANAADDDSPGRLHAPLRAIEPNVVTRLSSKPSVPGFQEFLSSSVDNRIKKQNEYLKRHASVDNSTKFPAATTSLFSALADKEDIHSDSNYQLSLALKNGNRLKSSMMMNTKRNGASSVLRRSRTL